MDQSIRLRRLDEHADVDPNQDADAHQVDTQHHDEAEDDNGDC